MAGYGSTLPAIRQLAAREAGKFHVSTVDTTSTTATVIDLTWPVNSSTAGAGLYKDYWIYTPASAATDKVRRIKTYTGTGGLLAVDTAYGVKPAAGAAYELHGMFAPSGNADSSWLTLINDGLKTIYMPVEISFNPSSATATRFTLATNAPWLSDPWLVRKGGVLSSGTDREANDPYLTGPLVDCICELDNPTVYLNTYPRTFRTNDTIYLQVLQPVYFAIQAAGVGPYTQAGMALETDVAPVDNPDVAAWAALVIAWRRFGQLLDTTVSGRLVNSLEQAVAQYNDYSPDYNMRYPMTMKRRRAWGPRRNVVGGVYSTWPRG